MCSDWDFVQGSVDVVLLLKKLCDDLRGIICPKLGWFRRCIRQRILVVCKCMHLLNIDILLNIVINKYVGMFEYNLPRLLHLMNTAK